MACVYGCLVVAGAKKADTLNAHLAKASVYNKLEQKNVTALARLRNDAAHGHVEIDDSAQVALLFQSVRDFSRGTRQREGQLDTNA